MRGPGETQALAVGAAPGPADAPERDAPERSTTAVELLWDLVFVFAVTQVTTLLAAHMSRSGFGRGMLALGR